MPFQIAGQCGPQAISTNTFAPVRLGNQGEIITQEMSGKHFEQTVRGNMFVYTVLAQALVLPATGGGMPTVINPVGSGVVFVPIALRLSYVSGTTVIGSVTFSTTLNVGGGASTGAPIPTATLVAAKSAFRGSPTGKVSNTLWSPTTNTFTAAPTVDFSAGLDLGAAAPTGTGTYEAKYDGAIAYYPGTAMSIGYTVTTSTALFTITLLGLELPVGALGT